MAAGLSPVVFFFFFFGRGDLEARRQRANTHSRDTHGCGTLSGNVQHAMQLTCPCARFCVCVCVRAQVCSVCHADPAGLRLHVRVPVRVLACAFHVGSLPPPCRIESLAPAFQQTLEPESRVRRQRQQRGQQRRGLLAARVELRQDRR